MLSTIARRFEVTGRITDENVEKFSRMRIKAQHVTREHVSCSEVTDDRDIQEVVGAKD
jgi:hypothetical protein